jgi:hypothetical protein
VSVDFREFSVVFSLSLMKWKSLFFRGVALVLFFGVGVNELCLVRSARISSDEYEFWVKNLEFVGEYEMFGNVVVLFGWTTPFDCITSVVVISLEVRI